MLSLYIYCIFESLLFIVEQERERGYPNVEGVETLQEDDLSPVVSHCLIRDL